MRLFVAIDIGEDARAAIAAAQRRIGRALGDDRSLRWIDPEQLHLTLVFLGEIPAARVVDIAAAVARPIDTVQPFRAAFGGVGVFPDRGAPRVLWLGLVAGVRETQALQQIVSDRLEPLGVAREPRPFHPHLTIGRWRDGRPGHRRRLAALTAPGDIASCDVARLTLYESRLSSSGPAYSAVVHAALTRSG